MPLPTLLALVFVAFASESTTFKGIVQDDQGKPIEGATVDIYTAAPRKGMAITCPSCYRDCEKETKTDEQGQFEIGELDESLLFRVLVMAPGKRSQLTDLTDPRTTKLEIKLEPLPTDLQPSHVLTGRVLDHLGKPLPGAIVTPRGAKTENSRWWGQLPGVDKASITDSEGRFILSSRESKLGLDLRVTAPGYADFPSQLFDLDGSKHEIRMQLGVSALGTLEFEGRPVSNRSIGIVQRDRSPEKFVGERVLATDSEGRFQFADLQPNEDYVLYTLCDRNQNLEPISTNAETRPVLRTKSVKTAKSGSLNQLGKLNLETSQSLTGKILFPPDSELPKEVKLRFSRDPAWDWIEVTIDMSGEFQFSGLPPEVYSVSVHAPGFEIDSSSFNYQMTGDSEFGMRLRSGEKKGKEVLIPMRMSPK